MILPQVYPILDTGLLLRRGCSPLDAARALLDSGALILQWRCKEFISRERVDEAEKISLACARYGVPFIVNDRADIARIFAAGLHVGQDDLQPSDARRVIGSTALLGYSTHNAAQLRAAADLPVDYIAIGPVFDTASKENPDPVIGLAALLELRSLVARPLVAIGGITRSNIRRVLAQGVDSAAVIGDLYPQECTPATIGRRFANWLEVVAGGRVEVS
jgi:thiamine-phosphate pyrophosphorylase